MNWIELLLKTLAGGIVLTLHASGADKHKTVAGQVAGLLAGASQVAAQADSLARSAAPPGTASGTP